MTLDYLGGKVRTCLYLDKECGLYFTKLEDKKNESI